jgi:hypothetical protein
MKLEIPPDWRLTFTLAGVALGLLAALVLEVAKRYL